MTRVPPPLSIAERLHVARQLAVWRVAEYLRFDSAAATFAAAWAGFAAGVFFAAVGRNERALASLTAAHRTNGSRVVCALVERILRQPADPRSAVTRRVNQA